MLPKENHRAWIEHPSPELGIKVEAVTKHIHGLAEPKSNTKTLGMVAWKVAFRAEDEQLKTCNISNTFLQAQQTDSGISTQS